jgi:hypothetical protein
MLQHRIRNVSILLGLSIIGALVVLFATRWGIGVSPDSLVYLSASSNLVGGKGFSLTSGSGEFAPITHHAPLYSATLSIPGYFGFDPDWSARILNALLFSINIFIFGLLASTFPKGISIAAWIIPTAGASLMLFSSTMVEIHLMAWTEPLFILLLMITLTLLAGYLEKPRSFLLIAPAVAAGLAFLTRYAGSTLIMTGILGIFLLLPGDLIKRIKMATVFGLMSSTPGALWLIRNYLAAGTAANREFIIHPISKTQLVIGLTTISGWFGIPESATTLVKLIPVSAAALGILGVFLLMPRLYPSQDARINTSESTRVPSIIKLALLFSMIYIIFLFFSISFFDANTPLDTRILSPVYVSGLLLGLYGVVWYLSLVPNYRPIYISIFALALWLSTHYTFESSRLISESYHTGIGLNSQAWLQSETMTALEKYPAEMIIYSNAPDAIYLHTGRPAFTLPRKFESAAQRINYTYDLDLAIVQAKLDSNQALIVYFSILNRPNLPTEEEIRTDLSLDVLASLSDGKIFKSVESTRNP